MNKKCYPAANPAQFEKAYLQKYSSMDSVSSFEIYEDIRGQFNTGIFDSLAVSINQEGDSNKINFQYSLTPLIKEVEIISSDTIDSASTELLIRTLTNKHYGGKLIFDAVRTLVVDYKNRGFVLFQLEHQNFDVATGKLTLEFDAGTISDEGAVVVAAGTPVKGLWVVLTGCLAIFVDRGAGRHKVMEWRAGDVSGALPYSRMVNSPGESIAQEPTDLLVISRDHLPALIRECHQVTSILVHKMLDRARVFTSSGLHDEKMISLGKLSAGLAHEMNNPVSAIERSAALLKERLEDAEAATRALGAARLTDAQLAAIDDVRASCGS